MARSSAKFACSIDAALLARVERIRARTGESRSAVVSRALAGLTEQEAHAERVRRYVAAYRERPELDDEVERATELARRTLAQVPWDKA